MLKRNSDDDGSVEARTNGSAGVRQALRFAMIDGAPRTASKVALVVGTILNLINQGEVLVGLRPVVWWKLVLTYCVPYLVCTYGIVSSRLLHQAQSPGHAMRASRDCGSDQS